MIDWEMVNKYSRISRVHAIQEYHEQLMELLGEHKHNMYGEMYLKEPQDPLCSCEERKVLDTYAGAYIRGAPTPNWTLCNRNGEVLCPACKRRLP